MRKIVSVILASVLAVSVLSGCGEKKEISGSNVDVVHVWTSDGGGKVVWEELVDKFNKTVGKEKGIKIDWTTSTDGQSLQVAEQNGELPEILTTSLTYVVKMAQNGSILPLEDFEGGKEFLEEYGQPGIEGRNMFDGKVYGVYSSSNVPGLIYNKDLFKKAGIVDENGEAKAPETYAEIVEYAKKITDEKNGIYGYSFPLKFGTHYTVSVPAATSFHDGLKVVDYDNVTVDYSNWKYAWDWILQLKKDNSLFPGAETLDNDTSRAYFAEGKIGMMPAMSWDVGVLTTQFVADCDWDVVKFPLYEGCEEGPMWRDLSGSYYISNNAKKIPDEKIMEVYKFIFSPETRAEMYERGIRISCKKDVLDMIDESKVDKRFLKFSQFLDESYKVLPELTYAMEGETESNVWQKLWLGKVTVDEAIKDLNTRATAALKKAVEEGKIDLSLYKE